MSSSKKNTRKRVNGSKSTLLLALSAAIAAGSSLVVLAEKPLAFGQVPRQEDNGPPAEAPMLGTIHGARSSLSPAPSTVPGLAAPNTVSGLAAPSKVAEPSSRNQMAPLNVAEPSSQTQMAPSRLTPTALPSQTPTALPSQTPTALPSQTQTALPSQTPTTLPRAAHSAPSHTTSVTPKAATQTTPRPQASVNTSVSMPSTSSTNLPSEASPSTISGIIALRDEQGKEVKPTAVLLFNRDLVFLSPTCLYLAREGAGALSLGAGDLSLKRIDPPKSFGQFRFQEFSNFVPFPARNSLVILDKTGDLYEYSPATNKWQLFRANLPFIKGQPDPEFIDLSVAGRYVNLLDPERNQVWRTAGGAPRMDGYMKDILPWKIKPGDTYVGDGLSMAGDDSNIYVLKKFGNIIRLSTVSGAPGNHQVPFKYRRIVGMRPSRIVTVPQSPLYIVERENNRVVAIDKTTGQTEQFLFAKSGDLRGLLPVPDGFWVLNNGKLMQRKILHPDSPRIACQRRVNDERLDGFIIPVKGVSIPRHVGVFPGARRLYRFGIHEGMDFFADPASRVKVAMNTPIRAAEGGKVLRVDTNFKDMTYSEFNRVMNDCYREHRTSDKNEDLFRGCQVWLSHGNGLITRYAHCNSVNPALRKDQTVARGELLAYIGVSGTGQNLPGRTKYPHLHFEIWLDGKYLGWGLTPAETMGVYEDIFGNGVGE